MIETEKTFMEKLEEAVELETQSKESIAAFSLADLLDTKFPEQKWLIEKLIPCDSVVLLTASPASFKSWLSQEMAASIAEGRKFLNEFVTSRGNVLILDEENNASELQRHFKMLGTHKDAPIHFMSQTAIKLDNEEHLRYVKEKIHERNIKLLVVDSLVRIHRGDENDSRSMARLFEVLRSSAKGGTTVLLIHHSRKTFSPSKLDNNDIRGSSDILAAADVHIAVVRTKDNKLIVKQTKLRQGVEMKPFEIEIDADNTTTLPLRYCGLYKNNKEEEAEDIRDGVLNLINDAMEPLSIKLLAERADCSEHKVRAAVKALVAEHAIKETTSQHNTKLYEHI